MYNVTLQINLCAGDIEYAEMTVSHLVELHHSHVDEKIAVVDCCKPQKTRCINPEAQYPEPEFSRKVRKISEIAEKLKRKGYFDRIIYFYSNSSVISRISRKYLRGLIRETHDWRGIALMAYLLGFDSCTTRYILHYDADMLLYQRHSYDWTFDAINIIENEFYTVAVSPRLSPPVNNNPHTHNDKSMPSDKVLCRNKWFSARCFLLDLEKLSKYLPLLKGFYLLEVLARKCLNRSYPPFVEAMLSRRIGEAGGFKAYLRSKDAWLLHPPDKSKYFISILPKIIKKVSKGYVPDKQRGRTDINLKVWEKYFRK